MKQIVLACLIMLIGASLYAQEYRSFDGTGNNLNNPEWGSTNTQFIRKVPPSYGDGFSTLGGQGWPNPRVVSNALFAQSGLINDVLGLSDYTWVFGQFIDHDVTLAPDDGTLGSNIYIQVPAGDPWFDPFNIGQALISMRRSRIVSGTGTGPGNPREHENFMTSFIDASSVYGSDLDRANWLRTFQNGKLKTSEGDMLPFNTIDGEYDSALDPNAPGMDDPVGMGPTHYVAGDVRANENSLLISFHTLFLREHNRICDTLLITHPDWTDEQIYQHARKFVGGMIQAIVYEEWLPTMGIHLPTYFGYDSSVDAGISNVFSAAAFRLGHTLLTDTIRRMDMEGETIPEGDLLLNQAFFNPMEVHNAGLEPFLKGMGVQIQQDMDHQVIDAVRNFLFGPPGAGGLDLASINITRGRERGIPNLNEVRLAFGLTPHETFEDLTGETTVSAILESLYVSIDSVDSWVGMLTEFHLPNALFGETIMTIMEDQFTALRNGDRFYYLNDPDLSLEEKELIGAARMAEIVCRNTAIPIMQENVFIATPHEMLCTADEPFAAINGGIQTEVSGNVSDVAISVLDLGQGLIIGSDITDSDGLFEATDLETCFGYRVVPEKDINVTNGVTTLDLVDIQKHVLGLDPLDSPYQHIAADANKSNTVSTLDLVAIRKIILLVDDAFPNNTSWRFVDANFVFDDPSFPLIEDFPEYADVANLNETTSVSFIAVKIGDVNNSVDPANLNGTDTRTGNTNLIVMDRVLPVGEWTEVAIYLEEMNSLNGIQFGINYDPTFVEFGGLENISLPQFTEDNFHHLETQSLISFSWNDVPFDMESDLPLVRLKFQAKQSGVFWSDVLTLNNNHLSGEMYTEESSVYQLALQFDASAEMQGKFALYQATPNPATGPVRISFFTPEAGPVKLEVYTIAGQMIHQELKEFSIGTQFFEYDTRQVNASGSLVYKVIQGESEYVGQIIRL